MLRASLLRAPLAQFSRSFQMAMPLAKGAAKVVVAKKRKQAFSPSGKKDLEKKSRSSGSTIRAFVEEVSFNKYNRSAESVDLAAMGGSALVRGAVLQYKDTLRRDLVRFGSFQKLQFHELFETPISLVRNETLEVERFVTKACASPSSANVLLISGRGGLGKSGLMAQTHAVALTKGAIVLPINNAERLVDGSNDFTLNTETGLYQQPMFVRRLLHKVLNGNKEALKDLKLSQEYTTLYKGKVTKYDTTLSLFDYIKGIKACLDTKNNAYFATVVAELAKQTKYPVLVTVDQISALSHYPFTKYRNTANEPIHFSDFEVAALLLDLVKGTKSFAKGGIVMATSAIHKTNDTLRVMLGQMQPRAYALSLEYDAVLGNTFLASSVQQLEIQPLDVSEIRAVAKVCIDAKVVPAATAATLADEAAMEVFVQQKYALSGNGNFRELFKSMVLFY